MITMRNTRRLSVQNATGQSITPDKKPPRTARSAREAGNLEWARLQELVTRIAAETVISGARFRWKSSGHHLILGPVAASFTFAEDPGGTLQRMHVVFGSVPVGMHGDKSSVAPKVWDLLPITHDNRTVVWAMDNNDRRMLLSEKLAAEIVAEVVKFYNASQKGH